MHVYRQRFLALAATTILGGGLRAETPEIEVYVGTKRVLPKPKPSPVAAPRAIAGLVDSFRTVTGSAIDSASKVTTRMLERAVPRWELPSVPVIVNVTLPPMPSTPSVIVPTGAFQSSGFGGSSGTPGLLPWVKTNTSQELVPLRSEPREDLKPTVIVVREAAPSSLAAEPPGLRLSNEVLLATAAFFGFGLVGTILIASARSKPQSLPLMPIAVATGHVAVGGRDAGPMPPAERFDLGPTYAEQAVQTKLAERAGADAMLLNILDQNLALRAELAASSETASGEK